MNIDDLIDHVSAYLTSISKPMTVVEIGAASIPEPPYLVIRQEGGNYRFTAHMEPGQQSYLRELVRKDLFNAVANQRINGLRLGTELTDVPGLIIASNDDGTISQERLFRSADIIL